MQRIALWGLGLVLAGLVSADLATAASKREKLARLSPPPNELPKACSLRWKVPPSRLSPADDSRELLAMTLDFWFGQDAGFAVQEVELATLNTYAPQWGDAEEDRVAIVSLAFHKTARAKAAEAHLRARYGESPLHRIGREDEYVVLFVARPSAGDACRDALWKDVKKRLDRASGFFF